MSHEICDQDVLHNTPNSDVFAHPMRVVFVDKANDRVWLSELQRQHPKKTSRMQTYFRAPRKFSLSDTQNHLRDLRIITTKAPGRRLLDMPDDAILKSAQTGREKRQFEKMISDRNQRWTSILPVLSGSKESNKPRNFLNIMEDVQLPQLIKVRAAELGMAPSTLYSLLNQYWAQGSRRNSLCTNLWRCGCPGQSKAQRAKLGRQSRLYKKGLSSKGFTLTDDDKTKLAWGYKLITDLVTANDAFDLASGAFWADSTVDHRGKRCSVLWPIDQRPTMGQFMYWGRKLNKNKSVRRMLLGESKWDLQAGARGGSLKDQVSCVAQLAYFDGTSTDVYLTSVRSRLIALPPMVRLILKEARSGVIYGWYCGWEPPSPQTAMQAILHGCESKVEYCKRYGVTIAEGDIPSFLAATHQADNGELKAARITEAESQFGFSVEYAQASRGDKKGGVESQHRTDHKSLDHKIPGTTFGRIPKRGDKKPVTQALWNQPEYMHEYIQSVLDSNNEEALEIAPQEMLKEEPNLKPTRLNIFNWLRKKGLTAELPCNVEALRAFLLPDQPAVIRKNGVYLMAMIHGRLQVVPKLRYTSEELVATGVLSRVKLARKDLRTSIKLRNGVLSEAWMSTKDGMIPLRLSGSDTLLRDRTCLEDWRTWLEDITLERDLKKGDAQQARLTKLLRIKSTTETARAQKKDEIKKQSKAPSKAEQQKGLRANRELERLLQAEEQAHLDDPAAEETPDLSVTTPRSEVVLTASARAMRNFQDSERGQHAN